MDDPASDIFILRRGNDTVVCGKEAATRWMSQGYKYDLTATTEARRVIRGSTPTTQE